MRKHILRHDPSRDDESWTFQVPAEFLAPARRQGFGKLIKFSPSEISLESAQFPVNRVLHEDESNKFILASFSELRFPDAGPRVGAEYIKRLMSTGLFLNNVQYRFYHHSNSQLRGRSCFLRQADNDDELDDRIYALGNFKEINNIAKRAKRIGLLFSAASIDYDLDPERTADIGDIKVGDEVFSDGCGLICRRLAVALSKRKRIIFRGARYTPCIFQIRYRGYKGVLMLHPQLDQPGKPLAQFRRSMKKFTATRNNTFSVVEYSQPYGFGRLNNDVIVLLSSLGITTETLLKKQEQYFEWIRKASQDITSAVDFLSCMGEYSLAERVLLDGLDDRRISQGIRSLQMKEVANFRKNEKPRTRMMVHKSRLLFGVCDPFQVLQEGEIHVRVTMGRQGATSLTNIDVLVVRNPCLHPGDCLKLRAVHRPELAHLVDCVVFASVARPGRKPAPAMTSGGDLDGDKFLICWDPDLIPTRLSQSYDYPGNREHVTNNITRKDLANHFASYNSSGVAKVATLHQKWARGSPNGALCTQCQELNALHSQSVDGAAIRVPDKLLSPPESKEPYVIDVLCDAATQFADRLAPSLALDANQPSRATVSDVEEATETILRLLKSDPEQHGVSEYELFNVAYSLARRFSIDIRRYLPHINFGALTVHQKYAISSTLDLTPHDEACMWNSFVRSDILTLGDLEDRQLGGPLHMQRLYSSKAQGLASFFEYLKTATQDFTRRALIIKTDDRFSVGIFMKGNVPWDEDPEVDDNVLVCSFMPQASSVMSTYRRGTKGYRLHCSDNLLQLYDKQRGNTFVFLSTPARGSSNEVITSIALQKISGRVRKQLGRLNRTPVTTIELHVISNKDRVAHERFDLRFDYVGTEEFIPRFSFQSTPYTRNTLTSIDWDQHPSWIKDICDSSPDLVPQATASRSNDELLLLIDLCINTHTEEHLYAAFNVLAGRDPLDTRIISLVMSRYPTLAFALLRLYPPTDLCDMHETISNLGSEIIENIVRSANKLGIASLVALEKLSTAIARLPLQVYLSLLNLAALCIRSEQLVQETLLVLNDSRKSAETMADEERYAAKHALGVVFDRAEEAADECPCDNNGRPRRQRKFPVPADLIPIDGESPYLMKADVRLDAPSPVRVNSHVRLELASKPSLGIDEQHILDGVVIQGSRGEMKIKLLYPPPPEILQMHWKMHGAGSVATSEAMLQAILALAKDGSTACRFHRLITGASASRQDRHVETGENADQDVGVERLNPSQIDAVRSSKRGLSLIWGPPGTGKTTVIIRILHQFLLNMPSEGTRVLMTASTHNAVDNVLERFIDLNKEAKLLPEDKILRVATDAFKVNKSLRSYTVDARVGGDLTQDNRLLTQAEKRVKEAIVVFTTCAGAGLGILRKFHFDSVLIDEASQISEPTALVPLVKGCKRAVLVGDHVQLRPMARRMAEVLEYDVSLLERLWKGPLMPSMTKTMLNIQYRFPEELASFPSREFYEGKLMSDIQDSAEVLKPLSTSAFPWPRRNGVIIPTVFVSCASEEDVGGSSKGNTGQAQLVAHIVKLLRQKATPDSAQASTSLADVPQKGKGKGKEKEKDKEDETKPLSITVLSPYSKQIRELQSRLSAVPSHTIDSFQGRESDIIIFSTVRCNTAGDIGFVEDARRLNVAWTRARLGLIIVGDRGTLAENSQLWKRAIESCAQVEIALPEAQS